MDKKKHDWKSVQNWCIEVSEFHSTAPRHMVQRGDCLHIDQRYKIKMADACKISARSTDFADRERFINQPRVQRRLHKLMRLGCRAEACAFSFYIVPGWGLIDNELAHRLRYQQISRRTSVFKAHTGRGSRRGWPPADILYLLHVTAAGWMAATLHLLTPPFTIHNAGVVLDKPIMPRDSTLWRHIFFLTGLKMRNAPPLVRKIFWDAIHFHGVDHCAQTVLFNCDQIQFGLSVLALCLYCEIN